tara:strand:- start:15951 stop:17282 length:1332 start_codon:yes stop_codon:yes gene_type:complete
MLADPCRPLGGIEAFSVASEKDQARAVFDQSRNMILQQPELSDEFKIYQHAIAVLDKGHSYRLLSADAKSKHGFNSSLILYDELHTAKDRELYDVLDTSTGAQDNPLFVIITTSDFDRPSICNEQLDYAEKVCSGVIKDDRYLPVLFKASLEDDWTDPAVWAKANPNLGVSLKMEYMEGKCQKAQDMPTYENTFKRLHLNIKTEQANRWLQLKLWDKCGGKLLPLEGRECFAGLDLASTTDIASLVLLFPYEDEDAEEGENPISFDILPIFWIPEATAEERERVDNVPYVTWAREGFMRTTPGNVIDFDIIRKDINELAEIYNINTIAFDRWGAQQISNQLDGDGFDMAGFGQGFKDMTPACKGLEKMIIGVQCRHDNNPVLRWMASNLAVETDAADGLKFSKKHSTEKIDGMVSLAMAYGRYDAQLIEDTSSPYDNGGISLV